MLTRTPLHLFEADERIRRTERRAARGDPESLARHAQQRIRGGENPISVSMDLHRRSPEAHKHLAAGLHPQHQDAMAAPKHLADYHRHEAVTKKNIGGHISLQALADRDRSLRRFRHAVEDAGGTPHEHFGPHPGEKGSEHRRRLLKVFGHSWGSEPHPRADWIAATSHLADHPHEVHSADIHDSHAEDREAGHAAVNHWYGKTHEIKSIPSPISRTTMYRVTPKAKENGPKKK